MTENLDYGFAPISYSTAKVLILGSMPGQHSLQQQQYYAHPRNAFWPIMQQIFGIDTQLPYQQRCQQLSHQGIALWDVLMACHRPGSLDQNIQTDSIIANPFGDFLNEHPQIQRIFFNGGSAEQLFKKFVLAGLAPDQQAIRRLKLPSTSPAHAAVNFDEKARIWQQALTDIQAL
ncbi:MAG: DNA-deoxyinosine glycosylase [Methylophaga sp.]|nr:DNA-deoxyinosine glycosylase [Methylophaga sp.]